MDLFDLGAAPKWLTCRCGEETNRVPCWECTKRDEESTARRERYESSCRTIPNAYAWSTQDAPELPKRVQMASAIETAVKQILSAANVLFVGPAGAGKTSLAVACLRERLDAGGIFVSSVALGVASIQHRAGVGEAPMIERACDAPLVLLDDVGTEQQTSVNAVPQVIFRRHERGLATWVTTGLKFHELQSRYGDGIARRITEGALIVRLGKVAE